MGNHKPATSSSTPPAVEVNVRLNVVIRLIFIVCVFFELLFVYLDATVNHSYWTEIGPIRRLFNITREDGLASLFGVFITLFTALTLWVLFTVEIQLKSSKWTRRGWLLMALFFSYMAIDDGSEVHERMGSAFKEIQARASSQGESTTWAASVHAAFPSYPWQLVYAPIFGTLGVFMLIFLWRRLQTRRRRFALIAALGLMAMAVGFDFIEGLDPDHPWNAYTILSEKYDMNVYTALKFRELAYDTLRHFSKSIEEFMEMLAMTVLLTTFLGHLGARTSRINVAFTS